MYLKAFGRTKDLVCKLYIQSVSIFWYFLKVLFTLQRRCLRANFSVSFHCPIGQWTYAKNWDWGGGLVTCMGTSTSFLYEYNYSLYIFFKLRLPAECVIAYAYRLLVLPAPWVSFLIRDERNNSKVKNFLSSWKYICTVTKSRW